MVEPAVIGSPAPSSTHVEQTGMNIGMSAPPIAGLGGMSISDAFNDLNPAPPGVEGSASVLRPAPYLDQEIYPQQDQQQQHGYPPRVPTYPSGYVAAPAPPHFVSIDRVQPSPDMSSMPPQSPARKPTPLNLDEAPVRTSSSGDNKSNPDVEELAKLRTILQKLQAENISLRAQLGQYSEEEKQIKQEVSNTVTEIGVLSQELTGVRNRVVEAKASLIEATAELKGYVEKRK